MKPTNVVLLALFAVLAGALTWVVVGDIYADLQPLPPYTPATVGVLGVVELYWAAVIRSRVHRRSQGRPIAATWVARAAALAKASALVGSLAFGAYAGYFAVVIGDLSATQHTHDATVSGGGILAGLLLAVAALALERACRVPPRDDDADDDARDGSLPRPRDGGHLR